MELVDKLTGKKVFMAELYAIFTRFVADRVISDDRGTLLSSKQVMILIDYVRSIDGLSEYQYVPSRHM